MNVTAADVLALAEVAAELGSADREQASSRLQEVAERVEPAVRELMASDCEAALRLVGAEPGCRGVRPCQPGPGSGTALFPERGQTHGMF